MNRTKKYENYLSTFELSDEERFKWEVLSTFYTTEYSDEIAREEIEYEQDDADLESDEIRLLALMEAAKKLTKRQQQIFYMWLEGLSQTEIAEKLGVRQSSVWLMLYGKKYKGKQNGGILRKLRKAVGSG